MFVTQRNIDKEKLSTLYKKHRGIEPVLSDLKHVIEIVEEKVEVPEDKNELLKYLHRINTQYVEVKEILIKSANAGLNLGVVIHEIDKLIAQLTGCIERNERKKALGISLTLEKIVRGYSIMIKKSDIELRPLNDIIEIALENYDFRFKDHTIKVLINHDNDDLNAYFALSESVSVLINLLDNSIYWLNYARRAGKIISIYVTEQIRGYNSIVISDNGPGFNIPTDVAIKPFITGKPHNIGSGLGLHIVNEMMKAMKGKLLFLDANDLSFPQNISSNKVNKSIIALCFPIKK